MVSIKDCQARYDRIKAILARLNKELEFTETQLLKNEVSIEDGVDKLGSFWGLKTRYAMEQHYMEDQFGKKLKGVEH